MASSGRSAAERSVTFRHLRAVLAWRIRGFLREEGKWGVSAPVARSSLFHLRLEARGRPFPHSPTGMARLPDRNGEKIAQADIPR